MANGVYMTPQGQIYQAASIGNAADSTLAVPAPELLTAAPSGRGSASPEATVKATASETRKANNQNH